MNIRENCGSHRELAARYSESTFVSTRRFGLEAQRTPAEFGQKCELVTGHAGTIIPCATVRKNYAVSAVSLPSSVGSTPSVESWFSVPSVEIDSSLPSAPVSSAFSSTSPSFTSPSWSWSSTSSPCSSWLSSSSAPSTSASASSSSSLSSSSWSSSSSPSSSVPSSSSASSPVWSNDASSLSSNFHNVVLTSFPILIYST